MAVTAALKTKSDQLLDEIMPIIVPLYSRWLDEREYEDIEDYGKVVKQKLSDDFEFVKMTKRPFGFHCTIRSALQSQDRKVKLAVTVNSRQLSCKVIK